MNRSLGPFRSAIARKLGVGGVLLSLWGLPAAGGPAGAGPAGPIVIGQPFPDLVLPSYDDSRPMSVSQLAGDKLVLHVFASW